MTEELLSHGWSPEKVAAFRQDLLKWYDDNKRDLPWRTSKNPYYIWISEIMLQQTQVNTVIPYFQRFIETLPTLKDLAQVDDETLFSLWQGLGYYSRARNLKVAANQIMDIYQGKMPQTYEELLSLQGIGPYTAAAIASMAFDQPVAAVDGNLLRVTARLFELDHDISKASSRKYFQNLLDQLIDPDRPGDFNQAMMDLGATIMTPTNYYPVNSPVAKYDASLINETAEKYPVKSKKIKATHHNWLGLILRDKDGRFCLRQHGDQELLKDLWHFPLLELEGDLSLLVDQEKLKETIANKYPYLQLGQMELVKNDYKPVKHVFSHRVWNIYLYEVLVDWQSFKAKEKVRLFKTEDLPAISSLQKKLLERWEEQADEINITLF